MFDKSRLIWTGVVVAGMLAGGCAVRDRLFRDRSELVAERSPCATTVVPIYFDEGHAGLSPPARELIRETAALLAPCAVERVRVVGLADASGGASRNLALSESRARNVAEAFAAEGWPVPVFEMLAAGEAGARTPEGENEPVRRRVEIIVEARPPQG